MSSSDLSSDERERELERERPKRVLRGEIKSGDDRREREREREKTSFLSSSKGALSLPSFFYPDAEYF